MFNKRKLISQAIEQSLTENSSSFVCENFDLIKKESYSKIGIDYWTWIDLLANIETKFSKDLSETTDKFKIDTIDELVNAIYNAPPQVSLFKNN